jgi:hypothetical protein
VLLCSLARQRVQYLFRVERDSRSCIPKWKDLLTCRQPITSPRTITSTFILAAHTGALPAFLFDTDDALPLTASRDELAPPKAHAPVAGEERLLRVGLIGVPNAGKSTLTNVLVGGTVTAVSVRPETTRRAALGAFVEGCAQVPVLSQALACVYEQFATAVQALRRRVPNTVPPRGVIGRVCVAPQCPAPSVPLVRPPWHPIVMPPHHWACHPTPVVQVILFDLPGMHGERDFLTRSRAMRVASAWLHAQDCHVHALIVDCAKQLSSLRTRHVAGLARVLGSDVGPEGFKDSWERKPVILILNKVDLLSKRQRQEVRAPLKSADPSTYVATFRGTTL